MIELTGTATARAVESRDTMNTVMLRAIKESQKDSGFFDVSVPASSSDPGIIEKCESADLLRLDNRILYVTDFVLGCFSQFG